ncbi:TPS2 (YDR074W) [Zygosaccharomyces parabailii]|nr:TPS2 (YDR074W) [Zygosaccharomyces parabailii]CDH10845.1 probable Trehalose-phosphatase [Zygosaccharomyces bailii ISA1307]
MASTSPKRQRIINCVTQLPYNIELGKTNNDWTILPATGSSSLYSSLEYLNSEEKSGEYEQHVLGWTGEVTRENTGRFVSKRNDNEVKEDEAEEDPLYLTADQIKGITADLHKQHEKYNQYNVANVHPVWLLRRDQERWRGFAENVLWPTFHYILQFSPDGSEKENMYWYDYVKFNEAYAMKIGEIYQKGDIIWIHDYYLLLLPQLLRMKFNDEDLTIAYYHHSPWPSNEYFRVLPRRKQILDGLMGADRVCFQNEGFSRHFVSSCKRLLDSTSKKSKNRLGMDQYQISAYGGDIVVDSLPIGVNKIKLLEETFTKDIDKKVLSIKEAFQGKKIIVGRDRLDSVHGVVQKLRAFETFLGMYPEWRDQVVLVQVSVPSKKGGADQVIRLEQQVNELVSSINFQYGSLNFSPVQHYYMRIPKDVYLSLMRAADLCIIASVRDGTNTTAMEYVTIKSHLSEYNCYGNPLILSEFSGISTVLKDAIIINPWDSVAVAKSINKALHLSREERTSLENRLSPEVPTIQGWTDKFLLTLKDITDEAQGSSDRKITPALNRPVLLENYRQAKRRLFLFDYDGTLTPIVQDPAAAIPSARLISILQKLAADSRNQIWIISGRDKKFLNKWLGSRLPQLGLSAEHGCFVKDVDDEHWVNLTEKFDMSWQAKVGKTMEEITNRTPGSVIERKQVALTWHYRRADPEQGEFYASELKKELAGLAEKYDLDIMAGKANVEVRPKFVNKGEIVKRLVWHHHGRRQDMLVANREHLAKEEMPDFIFCLGDDFTDEDMFAQLNKIEAVWKKEFAGQSNQWNGFGFYPCTVGSASKKTVAKAHLTDPQQVLDTLGLLVGDVSLFQSAGTVDLDSRGHVKNSDSSLRSEKASAQYLMRRQHSDLSAGSKKN